MENPTYDPVTGTRRSGAGPDGENRTGDKNKKKPSNRRTGTKWAVNRAIAAKLRKLDCDPVTLLARIATDEEAPVALRYRATARLAQMLHDPKAAPPPPPEPEPEPIDIGGMIAAMWREPDEEKKKE